MFGDLASVIMDKVDLVLWRLRRELNKLDVGGKGRGVEGGGGGYIIDYRIAGMYG